MANNIDIKEIVGKTAIEGLEKTNTELKESNDLIKEQIKLLDKLNIEYSETKNNIKLKETLNKQEQTNLKIQQEQQKIMLGNGKLKKQAIDLQIQQTKETERLTKNKEKEAAASKKVADRAKEESREYVKLNKLHKDAVKHASDLAAKYGTLDKRTKAATKAANQYDKQLKKIDKSLGKQQRSVGSYGKSILNFAGQLGLVTGAAALLKKGFEVVKDSILSIQTTGDKFTNSLAGMKEGYNSFIRGLASGTSFSDLIQNFKDATKAGAEYSAILDDLGDLQRSLRITESETRLEQEKLLTISRNVAETDEDRITAIEQYIKLEKELTAERTKNAKKAYAAEVLIAANRSDLSQSQIEEFLRNQEKYIEITQQRSQAEQDAEEERQRIALLPLDQQTDEIIKSLNEMYESTENLTRAEKLQAQEMERIIENAAQLDDAMRDRLVNAYTAVINVETASLKTSQRVLTMRGSLIKKMEDEKNKSVELREEIKITTDFQIEKEEEVTQGLTDELKKRYEANKVYLAKIKDDDIKSAEEKKALQQQITAELANIGNLAFDLQQTRLDKELDAVQNNYAARIAAAEGNSELQESLARELAKKQYEIQLEQFKSEQNQAYLNILINTATGVSKALAQGGTAGIVTGALVTAAGLAQAAIVQSQPAPTPPQFAKGTDSSPDTFIAGDGIGQSQELMITKDGQMMLTPNHATLYTGMEGTKILPADQTNEVLNAVALANGGAINTRQLENKLDGINSSINKLELTSIHNYGRTHDIQQGNRMSKRLNRFKN